MESVFLLIAVVLGSLLAGCGSRTDASAKQPAETSQNRKVAVVPVVRKTLQRSLTVSSELVPFQQIDVYAKEAGFVQKLNVDYGTHVQAGEVMAVLEIPELQVQLDEDQAAIKDAGSQVQRTREELDRVQAQQNVTHLEYTRLEQVAKGHPGLVAQQEVDDRQGRDLAAQAQVAASRATLESAQSELTKAQAKRHHDQVFYDYAKITAPFSGVVTKRYANLGSLMQSAISSTQALPLVQLSQDDKFRLVIPVPESYVPYIRVGDPAEVRVPSLNRNFPGKVARFSVDVEQDTRTMHTEVDVANPNRLLVPGTYAEATLTLNRADNVLALPQEAVNITGDKRTVWLVNPSGAGTGKVELRAITTGIETPDSIEVLSGLKEGDLVAVGDRSSLSPGESVTPKPITLIQPPSPPQQD